MRVDIGEHRPITKKLTLRRVSVSIFRISKYCNFNEANKKFIIVDGSEKLLKTLKTIRHTEKVLIKIFRPSKASSIKTHLQRETSIFSSHFESLWLQSL